MLRFRNGRGVRLSAGAALAGAFAACLVAVPEGRAAGAYPPALVADFTGAYQQDGVGSASSMELRIERQHKRAVRKARIFAMNLSEYVGKGRIAKDGTTATFKLRTSGHGRYVSHMTLAAQILDGAATLDGTYEITLRGVATRTGTFSVSR